ncbi:hypothetical protein ACFE04_005903 [Oxalis oulophora]
MDFNSSNRVKINLDCVTKGEVRDLKRRLTSELLKVRSLVKHLEKDGTLDTHSQLNKGDDEKKNRVGGTLKRVNSEVGSVGQGNLMPVNSRGMDNGGDFEQRENKLVKGIQRNKISSSAAGKGKSEKSVKLNKVSSSVNNNKMLKPDTEKVSFAASTPLYKSCTALLGNIMKHKFSWVFNEPVDAKKLGLRDYFTIVKHPMDLGTVKNRLSKNWYKSAKEFAEDVRLTFTNAILYNPKGQDVHFMADQLLKLFDEKWKEIENKFNLNKSVEQGNNFSIQTPTLKTPAIPVPGPALASPPIPRQAPEIRALERAESITKPVDSILKSQSSGQTLRSPVPKKPKSKELDIKEMSYDEKQRLSTSLQSLPPEKLDIVVQIIRKRNSKLFQEEDDIEVDLDSVDSETLWELDRFVSSYLESLSKNKRKAEVALPEMVEADSNIYEENLVPAAAEARTVTETAEKNISGHSPVQGEPRGDDIKRSKSSSSSGSSSSDSGSSSSDSDSNSSSGSGSDVGH